MTDAELLKYSCEHLHYEVWMLEEAAGRLLHAPLHFDRIVKNTVVESFTLHARAITTFLYPDRAQQRATDVTAGDFMADPVDWTTLRGALPATLLTVIQRTGKEIAHLTSGRLNYDAPNREWPVISITEALWVGLKLFAVHASPQRLDPAVAAFLAALESPTTAMRMTVYASTCTGVTTVSGPVLSTETR